jgi:hypothetical protein
MLCQKKKKILSFPQKKTLITKICLQNERVLMIFYFDILNIAKFS